MKVQSTGLGKTVMLAHLQDLFKTSFEDEQVLQVNMESTEPLHWVIKVYMEPKDIRRTVLMGLKPSILWKAFMAVVFGRFSLFGKTTAPAEVTGMDKTEIQVKKKDKPIRSSQKEKTAKNGVSTNPLASLKSGSKNEAKPNNPLASLKG